LRYIDVHCHINYDDYGDVENLMKSIKAAGVERLIAVGYDLATSCLSRDLSERFEGVYFTAGFHPTELKDYKAGDLEEIEKLLAHKKCVAIGEIGLDYHYPDTNKELQHEVFVAQLELAKRLNMPVQIHSRDCAEDMLNILREWAPKLSGGVMLHCFSHSAEIAVELEKLGAYFSFGGTSTYSGSKRAKKAIAAISTNRLLTETDSPYLPPKSKYGTFPNTPASIPEILENMAEIKGLCAEDMAGRVWDNSERFFTKMK
jgi:TatD DNase family protein